MVDKKLFNGRYCAVEINKSGIITAYNKNARLILSGNNPEKVPENVCITEFADSSENADFNPDHPEIIFSKITGIKLIDIAYYAETESFIAWFTSGNAALNSFFDVVKLSSSIFLELDADQSIIFASESFFKISGCSKSKVYGAGISAFIEKKSLTKITSSIELCRNNVLDSIKIDDIQFVFSNIPRIFDLDVHPVKDADNIFTGTIFHFIDTSHEKKFKQMSNTIRRMSAVANFAGGIAHDYNNALTAVLGNISLAKMDAEKNSELEELLKDAESAGLKIKTLTERLGMFSRGMKPAKTKTDIKVLIENIVSEIFAGYNGRCSVNIQDNLSYPEIDPDLISEAVRHVFENAIDAACKPSGEITISVGETEISKESVFRETSLVSGKYIVISVKDNGAGFEKHVINDIFDPYITTKPGREGLGLALTYTILKRHRGFISADSSDGEGAEFKIYIPLF